MFLNVIKDFFIKKSFRIKSVKKNIKTDEILILINIDSVSNLNALKNVLITEVFIGKKISFLNFKETIENKEPINLELASKESFNWKAKIIEDWIHKIVEKPYNICLSFSNENKYINSLVNSINAQYKFEISDTRNDIFDVSLISSMSENSNYIEELKNYLKLFNLIN